MSSGSFIQWVILFFHSAHLSILLVLITCYEYYSTTAQLVSVSYSVLFVLPLTCLCRLLHEPLVFCCSAISRQESSKVKQLARSLGAEVVSSWSERCSHLVMTTITVTVKVSWQLHTHTLYIHYPPSSLLLPPPSSSLFPPPPSPPPPSPPGGVSSLQLQASRNSSLA